MLVAGTDLSQAANAYQGFLVVTSGPLQGQAQAIKAYEAGKVTLATPLSAVPATGVEVVLIGRNNLAAVR